MPDRDTRAARHLTTADTSVQVHATHGIPRQVEVLRDVLTGLLQDDPTLEPRDIVVMCPDVDAYAPAITAAFGLGSVIEGGHPGHRLRVQIADRAPRTTNPVLAVAADLVGIAAGRATLSDVLALAASPPVRYRFALTDDDLATVETWARQAGIRWGLSGPLRRAYQLDRFDQNTWETGLDRLMTGVAMAEHELLVGDVLPLDDVSSADIDLAGRLAELLARVRACVEQLQDAGPVRERLTVLRDAVLSLSDTAPSDAWQLAQFERTMARVVAGVEAHAGPETEVRLTDLRGMLDVESGARPTRANFRTGNLTVCTMVPMRSVPHRVVCLLGLEDGTFPRTQAVDGDDVLARDPVTGELDLRSQDRQLLLDAVMAATEKLVLVYTAAHPGTGQERPPSVPLGELMDALDATAAGPVREQILVRHPLQPNDARNVTAGALVPEEPFSFDPAALSGAQAARAPRPAPAFLDAPLPTADRPPSSPSPTSRPSSATPPGRSSASGWTSPHRATPTSRTRVCRSTRTPWRSGPSATACCAGCWPVRRPNPSSSPRSAAAGCPPTCSARGSSTTSVARRPASSTRRRSCGPNPREAVTVDVDLGDGRRLVGTVTDVRGDRIVRIGYSSVSPRRRLGSWLDLVSLAAGEPSRPWTAVTVGRQGRGTRASRVGPLGATASSLLRDLVAVYDAGMREPLPLPVKTSAAWAEAVHRSRHPLYSARQAWEGKDYADPFAENRDRAFGTVFGETCSFARVSGNPHDDEDPTRQGSRLGAYAVRVWGPLLLSERLGGL